MPGKSGNRHAGAALCATLPSTVRCVKCAYVCLCECVPLMRDTLCFLLNGLIMLFNHVFFFSEEWGVSWCVCVCVCACVPTCDLARA